MTLIELLALGRAASVGASSQILYSACADHVYGDAIKMRLGYANSRTRAVLTIETTFAELCENVTAAASAVSEDGTKDHLGLLTSSPSWGGRHGDADATEINALFLDSDDAGPIDGVIGILNKVGVHYCLVESSGCTAAKAKYHLIIPIVPVRIPVDAPPMDIDGNRVDDQDPRYLERDRGVKIWKDQVWKKIYCTVAGALAAWGAMGDFDPKMASPMQPLYDAVRLTAAHPARRVDHTGGLKGYVLDVTKLAGMLAGEIHSPAAQPSVVTPWTGPRKQLLNRAAHYLGACKGKRDGDWRNNAAYEAIMSTGTGFDLTEEEIATMALAWNGKVMEPPIDEKKIKDMARRAALREPLAPYQRGYLRDKGKKGADSATTPPPSNSAPAPAPVSPDSSASFATICLSYSVITEAGVVLRYNTTTAEIAGKVMDVLPQIDGLYQRAGRLVECAMDEDGPVFRDLPMSGLGWHLSEPRWIRWYDCEIKQKVPYDIPVSCPNSIAQMVLERGAWPGVPVLQAVHAAPILTPTGRIVESGYDPETKVLVAAPLSLPARGTTQADAAAAVERLANLTKQFLWQDEKTDFGGWLAFLLTVACRHALGDKGMPIFAVLANKEGSGKTRLVDLVQTIVTGRSIAIQPWNAKEEENRKLISSHVKRGTNLLAFDNATNRINSPALAGVLTSRTLMDRILGASEIMCARIDMTVAFTGNGLTFSKELEDRTVRINLESHVADPRSGRKFDIEDIMAYVGAHRAEYLADALCIVRAYLLAGCPGEPLQVGSFEHWAKVIRGAIVWASNGDYDIAARNAAHNAEDESKDLLMAVERACIEIDAGGISVKQIMAGSTAGAAAVLDWMRENEDEPTSKIVKTTLSRLFKKPLLCHDGKTRTLVAVGHLFRVNVESEDGLQALGAEWHAAVGLDWARPSDVIGTRRLQGLVGKVFEVPGVGQVLFERRATRTSKGWPWRLVKVGEVKGEEGVVKEGGREEAKVVADQVQPVAAETPPAAPASPQAAPPATACPVPGAPANVAPAQAQSAPQAKSVATVHPVPAAPVNVPAAAKSLQGMLAAAGVETVPVVAPVVADVPEDDIPF
jgi:hypothetical protein